MRSCVASLLVAASLLACGSAGAARGRVLYGYPYAHRCPAAGLEDLVDRWGMYECNCTSYVAWALQANGQRTDWFVPGAMDARNWPHVARLARIPVGTRPRVGAVAVWPRVAPPFGHVAYVAAVEPGGGIDVAEYNYRPGAGFQPFDFDIRRGVSPRGAVFIDVPARNA